MAPTSSLVGKIKVQLKLAISRLRMVQQKDTAIAKQQRRAMAVLLEQGKVESARIRVENIIRSDITTELHEILELYCELLLARTGLLDSPSSSSSSSSSAGCDPGLEEALKSLIHAAPRTDIRELHAVRALLVEKFGKEFALDAAENRTGKVAERVVAKLRVEPPSEELVEGYLAEIARTYGVNWPPRGDVEEGGDGEGDDGDDEPGSGGRAVVNDNKEDLETPLTTEELSRATPPRDLGPKSPVSVAPPSPRTENLSPRVKVAGAPLELKPGGNMVGDGGLGKKKGTAAAAAAGGSEVEDGDGERGGGGGRGGVKVGGKIPDVDDLQRRFADLKRRG